MATAATIKKNIAKLEAALKSKATPKSLKSKLEVQLVKSKAELSGINKGTKPKASTTKSTQTALQKLKDMVKKNKKLKTYKGAGVDLEKDADRPALPTGRRTAKQSGKTYYEYRANRIDVKQPPKKYPKLEKGGYMAKGGGVGRTVMIPTYVVKEINDSVKMGYDTIVEGMIGRKRKGVMLINDKYEVRGTYDIGLKDAIQNIIDKIKSGTFKVDAVDSKADGGYMAKGGVLEYESILDVLKEKIDDSIEELPSDYEMAAETFKGEEVEHESRDGFIAYTDGGYEARWFDNVGHLNGSGISLPTAGLDAEMQRQVDYNYEIAKDKFKDEYPDIVEELGEDNIEYNALYDAGYESEAEQLSEWEMDYDGDDTIMMEIGAFYYNPENSRGKDNKHTMFVFANVNLESPYHRSGNLEDGIDHTFTFNSLDELKEKMDENLKKIVDWFDGKNYKEGKKDLKITRMAKGGSLKDNFSDKIEEGDIVWDERNKNYGVVLNTYDYQYGEIRLDSDGNQPIEYLHKLGSEGDKGTKAKLQDALIAYKSLRLKWPEYKYEKVNYAKGGLTEHGLKVGDTIVDDMFWDKSVKVLNSKTGYAVVKIETGERKEMKAMGGEMHRTQE